MRCLSGLLGLFWPIVDASWTHSCLNSAYTCFAPPSLPTPPHPSNLTTDPPSISPSPHYAGLKSAHT